MESSRKSVLLKIIEIDYEINKIKANSNYRIAKRNLRILRESRFGNRIFRVRDPDDSKKLIEIRRNSNKMKDILSKYEFIVDNYSRELLILAQEKAALKKKLFT